MKKKVVSLLFITMGIATCLTACNPVETIKSKFVKDEDEIMSLPVEEDEMSELSFMSGEYNVGDVITTEDVMSCVLSPKSVPLDITLYDDDGMPVTEYEVSDTSSEFMVSITWEDGSIEEGMFPISLGAEEDTVPAETPDVVYAPTELPMEWQDLIDAGDYTLQKYDTEYGDKVFYLKRNATFTNMQGSASIDGYKEEIVSYDEIGSYHIQMSYANKYVDPMESIETMVRGMFEEFFPQTEEEFNAQVEDGSIEIDDGTTWEEYQQMQSAVSNIGDYFQSTTESITTDEGLSFEVITSMMDARIALGDWSNLQESDPMLVYSGTRAYATLPNGGIILFYVTDDSYSDTTDDGELSDEDKLEQIKKAQEKTDTYKAEARSAIMTEISRVSAKDYSAFLGQAPVDEDEEESESDEELDEELPTQTSTTTTTTTTTTTKTEVSNVGIPYAERYPSLYEWPDQQKIYNLEPKRVIYDVLSATDSQGNTVYEECIIPMWATNERKFLNTMDFGLAAANRQTAQTVVQTPTQSSTGSGLFSSSGSSSSSSTKKDDDDDEEKASAVLSTSFGQFLVKSNNEAEVDPKRSTNSQVFLRDASGNGYRVMGTTTASIEKNRNDCIYEIPNANMGTWKCNTGSQETTTLGIITRYYMTYEDNDNKVHTCEYMYTISTTSGYILVICDYTPDTTFSTMYAICKTIVAQEE